MVFQPTHPSLARPAVDSQVPEELPRWHGAAGFPGFPPEPESHMARSHMAERHGQPVVFPHAKPRLGRALVGHHNLSVHLTPTLQKPTDSGLRPARLAHAHTNAHARSPQRRRRRRARAGAPFPHLLRAYRIGDGKALEGSPCVDPSLACYLVSPGPSPPSCNFSLVPFPFSIIVTSVSSSWHPSHDASPGSRPLQPTTPSLLLQSKDRAMASVRDFPTIKAVRSFVIGGVGSGGDYHNVAGGHW